MGCEDTYWNTNNSIYGDNPQYIGNNPVPNQPAIIQSLNLYVYAMSNPLKYYDPMGLAVIFMTHGLDDSAYCFVGTDGGAIKNLKNDNPSKYISFGVVTAGRGDANGQYYTGSDQAGLYMNDDVREKGIELFGRDFQNDPAKVAQLMDYYTDQGIDVLIRTEFSAGNLSFDTQLTQFGEMVDRFGNFKDDVTFLGHSMGGLASINYGVDYALKEENKNKQVNIITISIPYVANNWSKDKNVATLGAYAALRDLSSKKAIGKIKDKWEKYKKDEGTAELYAIGIVATAPGNGKDSDREKRGDGIMSLSDQLGGDWNSAYISETFTITGNGKTKIDVWDTGDSYHHMNTPRLPEVAKHINNLINK